MLIKISDSGCGIPREQQPKIFTKLFRADNVRKIESVGTGLGLYIVKAVVEKSGGKIWFQSPSLELLLSDGQNDSDIPLDKRNRGTTFFITIPSFHFSQHGNRTRVRSHCWSSSWIPRWLTTDPFLFSSFRPSSM